MTTKQNDAAAMTQEQLAEVSGGPHIRNYGVTAPIQQRRSNRVTDSPTGNDVDIWTMGGTTRIWTTGGTTRFLAINAPAPGVPH